MKIMVINGPNLNMLKYRDNDVYGNYSLEDINNMIEQKHQNINFTFVQGNCEGKIIGYIHKCVLEQYDGLIINPGAYSHYSYAIYDALLIFKNIKIEVHLSDVNNRDNFRKKLITAQACDIVISELEYKGYLKAVDQIIIKSEAK